jgi:hypothetical protein
MRSLEQSTSILAETVAKSKDLGKILACLKKLKYFINHSKD